MNEETEFDRRDFIKSALTGLGALALSQGLSSQAFAVTKAEASSSDASELCELLDEAWDFEFSGSAGSCSGMSGDPYQFSEEFFGDEPFDF